MLELRWVYFSLLKGHALGVVVNSCNAPGFWRPHKASPYRFDDRMSDPVIFRCGARMVSRGQWHHHQLFWTTFARVSL